MTFGLCSFASGSSGNCYLVKSDKTAVLVDAGISGKRIFEGLEQTETPREMLAALLVTHEHSDHTKSIGMLAKKEKGLAVYASSGTWESLPSVCKEQRRAFQVGERFAVGDIEVQTFGLSHDAADPAGYTFFAGGRQISIVTDTGCINETIMDAIRDADVLVLEANHDVDMLRIGKYPWFLKQRILSDCGHLSNDTAGRTLARLLSEQPKRRQVLLAHLSRENNFPEMAYQTIKNILEESALYIGDQISLEVLRRNEISPFYNV